MSEDWLYIEVELVSGRGEDYWPRPGKIFLASPSHTFWQLADAINVGFGRWDHSHLSEFVMADGSRIGFTGPEFDDFGDTLDIEAETLTRLQPSEQFAFMFDFGDGWTHLCTVHPDRVDPEDRYGSIPESAVPIWGWGSLPDQYGRRWRDDEGDSPMPPDPRGADLPPLLREWE
jgi:hypothetical protein